MNFLASYTLRPRHRPRVGPEHRRRAAAGAAGDDRRRGVDRSGAGVRKGRRAVRRAPPLRLQLRRGAADADAAGLASSSTSLGGWQVNGIVQGQTGFPPAVYDPTTDIRYLTNRPDRDLRSERRTRRTPSISGSTPSASRAARSPTRARARATPAATPSAAPASRAPTCRCSRTSRCRRRTACSCASRHSTCSTRRASASPAARSARRISARSPSAEDGRIIQLAAKYTFLGAALGSRGLGTASSISRLNRGAWSCADLAGRASSARRSRKRRSSCDTHCHRTPPPHRHPRGIASRQAPNGPAGGGSWRGKGLTDVQGIKVGHFTLTERPTGCTAILVDRTGRPAACDVRGGAPGTRETDLLNPLNKVDRWSTRSSLSGGSAYGLDAAQGVDALARGAQHRLQGRRRRRADRAGGDPDGPRVRRRLEDPADGGLRLQGRGSRAAMVRWPRATSARGPARRSARWARAGR